MQNAADHYLADKVMTAGPATLTGMLYDGAAAAVRGMIRTQEAGQHSAAVTRSLKAQNILMELRCSLDHEAGGRLSADLERLYAWAMASLVRATSDNDVTAARDALQVLEQLASAWQEACVGAVAAPA